MIPERPFSHPDVVIYHGGCPDGFAAAWVAHRRWPTACLRPQTHGRPWPSPSGYVLAVDIAPSTEKDWQRLRRHAHRLQVLDHHITLLRTAPAAPELVLNLDRSGVEMMWRLAFPDIEMPGPLRWIADRDCGRPLTPTAHAMLAVLDTLPHDHRAWSDWLRRATALDDVQKNRGHAILTRRRAWIAVQWRRARPIRDGTHEGWGLFVPPRWLDLAAAQMDVAQPGSSRPSHRVFVRTHHRDRTGIWHLSWRPAPSASIDVEPLARRWGGGGHPHAAAARVRDVRCTRQGGIKVTPLPGSDRHDNKPWSG